MYWKLWLKLAKKHSFPKKFEALYNGAVINTGENRLVLHQLTRGQLGDAVVADGVDKRKFYVEQQERIAGVRKQGSLRRDYKRSRR